ncbi:bifunctional metallophosphatase/5'-nucleotidase [Saccharicrinis sp. GN24d3]|uniref:bifunctional metallophosphatase/5'-nucleotidase n=1 Tax=Saccharicrinis sp. GN24d3 TaxID=3458416 RepID=UPI004035AAB3
MEKGRRQFLKTMAIGSAAGVFSFPACTEQGGRTKLTILHTNDVHSHIDPFPENHPKYAGKGGYARRFALIKQVRQQEEHVILLDAGDIFQGTPYFNYYKGELDIKLMSDMGYDAGTIGNHEFDNGIDDLATQIKKSKFPFVCSNYKVSSSALEGLTSLYKIIEKGPIKIGIIGLGIELSGLVTPLNYRGVEYMDPIVEGDKVAKFLKEKRRCNLVIALSHLGYEYKGAMVSDVVLAKQTNYIDVILGGHTHTFLDKPVIVSNIKKQDVIINQTGWGGINLGRLDFVFDNLKKTKQLAYHTQL